ncbi:MAG: tetrahydromethanopterin S-methyltransferase subunit H [Candidatus Thorarchaeota archaeon]|nr:tetrahydromethanopterin S-methyltransferase subunit H [Candidatus Thorarchaeota archaeon]
MNHNDDYGEHTMNHFSTEQRVLQIGEVHVGGRPGLEPTVLIGSIFYSKDKSVENDRTGTINKSIVEDELYKLTNVSETTGLPSMLDVVATTPEAMRNYLSYLADITDMPLLIDGSGSNEVNISGLEVARNLDILDRVVLNSIIPETGDSTLEHVKELGLKNAILLAFDSESMASASKRVDLANKLVERVKSVGIDNIMIDTGVVDMLTLGLACKALGTIKETLGYPVGCGAHNSVNTWAGLTQKFGKEAKRPALVGSSLMPVVLGADFVLYGPIKNAGIVFPSIAMIDTALSGMLLEDGIRPDRNHPRFRIG